MCLLRSSGIVCICIFMQFTVLRCSSMRFGCSSCMLILVSGEMYVHKGTKSNVPAHIPELLLPSGVKSSAFPLPTLLCRTSSHPSILTLQSCKVWRPSHLASGEEPDFMSRETGQPGMFAELTLGVERDSSAWLTEGSGSWVRLGMKRKDMEVANYKCLQPWA